jgi:DNA primase
VIDDATIERVREAADIVGIIGEHTKLRRTGGSWRGPCPLHGGKNPNFSVTPDKGFYHCFTCGESGDVFTFLNKVSGMDFLTAVRAVAERSGIEIVETNVRSEERDTRERLWEVLEAAAEFFARALWQDPAGAAARGYLESRGITREVADRFRLGYAPNGAGMQQHLVALGFDDARMLEVGLLSTREGQEAAYPRFRDRLTILIHDAAGHPVGFGARLLADREGVAKYLNSPETPLFAKRRLLYNMHAAKSAIRREDRVLVVEGYFDVIRLAAAGLQTVVAGLGTALTESHAELLGRLTRNVFLLYDSDEAGQKATFRAGLELLRQGLSARVVTLTDGEDPDTFVAKYGVERLEQALGGAMDLFDRQVQILERRGWFADLHKRRRAIDKLLPTIRAAADPITRDLYVARLADAAGVDKSLILTEVSLPERGSRVRQGGTAPEPSGLSEPPDAGPPQRGGWTRKGFQRDSPFPDNMPDGKPRKPFVRRGPGGRRAEDWASDVSLSRPAEENPSERMVLRIVLRDRAYLESVLERFGPDSFRSRGYADVVRAMIDAGPNATPDELEHFLDQDGIDVVNRLQSVGDEIIDVDLNLQASLTKLRIRDIDARSAELDGLMLGASDDFKNAAIAEKQRLRDEKQALGGQSNKKFLPRDKRA